MQLSASVPPASRNYPYSAASTRSKQHSIPKGSQEVRPANQGLYTAPATTGRDDDLMRDARPANQGLYAVPATTGRDDNLTRDA